VTTDRYILNEQGEPERCEDLHRWARWYEDINHRRLAEDFIGNVRVSTVFLALDHAFHGGPPVLWETMIFGGREEGYQERYASREAALRGHAEAVAKAHRKTLKLVP
jgi:hypothetical protein